MIKHSNMKHILHLEEFALVPDNINFIKEVLLSFKDLNNISLTHKMDGAPAIYFGTHTENGKFFVGTKSIFNIRKDKLFNYSNYDINNNYLDSSPGLKNVLKRSLQYLKKIYPNDGKIYQGDILFTDNKDKSYDRTCIRFKPNTVEYIIENKSEDFYKIRNATFGIAIHSVSDTLNLHDFKPIDNIINFKNSNDVYIDNLKVISTEYINTDVLVHLIDRLSVIGRDEYVPYYDIDVKLLRRYFNSCVRNNHRVFSFDDMLSFIKNHYEPKILGYKTDKAKMKYIEILSNISIELALNKKHYCKMLYMYEILSDFKDILLSLLATSNHKYMYCINDKLSGPEGYVMNHDGIPVKLVDRYEFSINNFNLY